MAHSRSIKIIVGAIWRFFILRKNMSINANRLVSITPRIIGAGSADLETNGLLLTQNALIPADSPALEFVITLVRSLLRQTLLINTSQE